MKPNCLNQESKIRTSSSVGISEGKAFGFFKLSKGIFLILILFPTFCFCQDEPEKAGEGDSRYDFSLSYGAFLPFGLVGVRDDYPVGGISLAHPFWFSTLEWSSHFFNAKGVSLAQGGVSFRFLSQMISLMDTYVGFGPEVTRYQRLESAIGKYPFVTRGSFHFMFGGMVPVTDAVSIRANFKYSMMSPAHVLIATLGLNFQF